MKTEAVQAHRSRFNLQSQTQCKRQTETSDERLPQRMMEVVVGPSCPGTAKSNEPVFNMQCICRL
ncbi:hypothetical protein DPMN_077650 [Dreissena polymorpha]|uniref:Uncharacterized protein n=1 Tax=Dreissena polymorpha TaxID=45954 RepID=A0A9D3YP16_DREPO|nr:hypothetical protein DPMN_077650 [Dreissena polymorpha]